MTLLKAVDAKYLGGYKIELSFNDGSNGIVDLEKKVYSDHRQVFNLLQNIELFKKFKLNRWTIEWENGADLAPEFLYSLLTKQNVVAN